MLERKESEQIRKKQRNLFKNPEIMKKKKTKENESTGKEERTKYKRNSEKK